MRCGSLKGTSGGKKVKLKYKSVGNAKQRAVTDFNGPDSSGDIPLQSQEFEQLLTSPFCRFLASFSIKYDVTEAMQQDIEKMKVQYHISLLFDLFEILQAVTSKQVSSA